MFLPSLRRCRIALLRWRRRLKVGLRHSHLQNFQDNQSRLRTARETRRSIVERNRPTTCLGHPRPHPTHILNFLIICIHMASRYHRHHRLFRSIILISFINIPIISIDIIIITRHLFPHSVQPHHIYHTSSHTQLPPCLCRLPHSCTCLKSLRVSSTQSLF